MRNGRCTADLLDNREHLTDGQFADLGNGLLDPGLSARQLTAWIAGSSADMERSDPQMH
jgi:hypothetical protein